MNDRIKTMESCQDSSDSSLSMSEALALIRAKITPLSGFQAVALRDGLGRVLAKPIVSPMNVPAHRNSAMDGYALRGQDLPTEGRCELQVVGTVFAGRPCVKTLAPGQCVRIMTGAKMPASADTVVMQERVERVGDSITVDAHNRPGQNVRQAGEDIAEGGVVLAAGRIVNAPQLGLLASLGIAELAVRRRPRVAFFSSGDEIRSIGEVLAEGQIYDSNRYTLHGMLTKLGAEAIDLGVIPDREETISASLLEASQAADLILTSGGVSVGEADHVVAALRRLGTIHFSKVAIKPGRPLTFGHIGNTPFFGLPGNPVAVMTTFLQFTRPAILQLRGESDLTLPQFELPCRSRLRKSPGRTEFQRGIIEREPDNGWTVRSSGRQGSGVLSSMSEGNCFIVLPERRGTVEPGEIVSVQPFALFD
ncbi:MAG: molybdopterin molybdotransferase MoeA [Chromatiaceae bacterium]|nr:molybdopterin molybdotransferase MoeA [Chromatiaceae bacterium]